MKITKTIASSDARANFADTLKTVVYGGQIVGIMMHGKIVAAIVPVKSEEKVKNTKK